MDTQQFFSSDQAALKGNSRRIALQPHQYGICPYNCIGLIKSNWKGKQVIATGFLISSCLVLTSAHSFYMFDKNQIVEMKPVSFSISENGQNQDVIKFQGDYHLCKNYTEILNKIKMLNDQNIAIKLSNLSQNKKKARLAYIKQECYRLKQESQKYDYALLKVEKMIDRQHYFNLQLPDKNNVVTVCGYSKNSGQAMIFYHSNKLIKSPLGGLYDIDTESGQSGSPVFTENDKTEVVGIHKGYESKQNLNICTLVSQQMIADIVQWSRLFCLEKVFFRIPSTLEQKFNSKSPVLYSKIKGNSEFKGSKLSDSNLKQKELCYLEAEIQNLNKKLIIATEEKQQAIKILNECKIINQHQKSKLQEEKIKLKQQLQKNNPKNVKQVKFIKESITQGDYICIAQQLEKFSAAERKQIIQLQITNTSKHLSKKTVIIHTSRSMNAQTKGKLYKIKAYEYKNLAQVRDHIAVYQIKLRVASFLSRSNIFKMKYVKINQISVNGIAFSGTFEITKSNHHIIQTVRLIIRRRLVNDNQDLVKLVTSCVNMKTFIWRFRHSLDNDENYMNFARKLNMMNSLQTIYVQYDEEYEPQNDAKNFTNSARQNCGKFKVKTIKWPQSEQEQQDYQGEA